MATHSSNVLIVYIRKAEGLASDGRWRAMRFCNGAEAATSCITFAVAKAAPPWLLEATPQALRPSRMLEVLGVLVIASLRAQNISWYCALSLFVLSRAIQTQACARGTRCTYFSR